MVTKTIHHSRCHVKVTIKKRRKSENVVQLDIKHFSCLTLYKQALDFNVYCKMEPEK